VNAETDRGSVDPVLLLRPWAESDATALREAIDEDVDHLKPWLSWTLEEPATLERTRARLRSYIEQFAKGSALRFAIVPTEDPVRILGGAGLATRFGPDAHDLGYWVRRAATGRGIARSAIAALGIHAFAARHVTRLMIQCDVANERSVTFARSLGFRSIGRAVTEYPNGTPRPVLRFEMSRADFDNGNASAFRELARKVAIVTRSSGEA
jgi:RimJ/RimL family protein N-acetyltransferase